MMSLALDHVIFGNGHGMKSPYCDNVFYWLDGRLYNWIGGFGAQLRSRQWTHPLAGERRRLLGRDFVAFNSRRTGPRVEVAWSMVGIDGRNIDEANAAIRSLKADLERL